MHLPVKLVSIATTVGRVLYRNAPKIMVAGGVITSVAAIAEAVHATPRAIDILEDHKEMVEKIKEAKELNDPNYTIKDYKKDMFGQYTRTIGGLTKVYSKAIALEGLSLSLFIGAAHIFTKRNKVLASTLLATVDAATSDRQKVIDALGEEKANEIFNGIKEVAVEKEVTDEKGKTKTVTETKYVATSKDPYFTTVWTELDPDWDQCYEFNENRVWDIANSFSKKVFGTKDEFGRTLKNPMPNFHVSMNDMNKYFKWPDDPEHWTQEHQVVGWNNDHPDGKIIPHMRHVSVPHPDNPNHLIDAMIINWNAGGSICPKLVP